MNGFSSVYSKWPRVACYRFYCCLTLRYANLGGDPLIERERVLEGGSVSPLQFTVRITDIIDIDMLIALYLLWNREKKLCSSHTILKFFRLQTVFDIQYSK